MPMLFRMASFIEEADDEAAAEEAEEDLVSRPNILGSIPMDFNTLGSIAPNIEDFGSNILGSIPMLASILGSIPARALGSNIFDSIEGSIPAACSNFGSI